MQAAGSAMLLIDEDNVEARARATVIRLLIHKCHEKGIGSNESNGTKLYISYKFG
jgi:hypothetical protein